MRTVIVASFFLLPFFRSNDPAGLHQLAAFPIGVALDNEKLRFEERYWQVALREFNSFTPERLMKFAFIHPKKEQFRFTETDELLRFCKERNIRVHGHTLVWHRDLPGWLYKVKNEDQFRTIFKAHIEQVVTHCKGKVNAWDVVNEAFEDDGRLRRSIWLERLGPDYLAAAFREAALSDPATLLFYNDYGLEVPGPKLDSVISTLNLLRKSGVRVDGIGVQMHILPDAPDSSQIAQAFASMVKAGFKVHISEMDVRVTGSHVRNKQHAQALKYRQVAAIYKRLPSWCRHGITLWAVSDADSWLTGEKIRSKPMLFDDRYEKKEAYAAFAEGLGIAY